MTNKIEKISDLDFLIISNCTLEQFEPVQLLGRGAFAAVKLVRDLKNNELLTLKSTEKQFLKSIKKLHYAKKEKLILEHLSDPKIVSLKDFFETDTEFFFLMEFIPLGTLMSYIEERGKLLGKPELKFIVSELLEMIEFCHSKGVMHKDLKPENIMIDVNRHLKLIDFGTAECFEVDGESERLKCILKDLRWNEIKTNEIEELKNGFKTKQNGDKHTNNQANKNLNETETICYKIINEMLSSVVFQETENLICKKSVTNFAVKDFSDDAYFNNFVYRSEIGSHRKEKELAKFEKYLSQREESINRKNSGLVGTILYMSPEMIVQSPIDYTTDLWSFGVIIFSMLTGNTLDFDPYNHKSIQIAVDRQINEAINLEEDERELLKVLLSLNKSNRGVVFEEGKAPNYTLLKSLRFFEGVDWANLRKQESPLDFESSEGLREVINSHRRTQISSLMGKGNKVLFSGLVKKMKYMLFFNTRQLILYNNQILEYMDPQTNEKKGKIDLSKMIKITCDTDTRFSIEMPKRKYIFESLEYPSSEWVWHISSCKEQVSEYNFG